MIRFAPACALLVLCASAAFGAVRTCPSETSDEYFFPSGLLETGNSDAFTRHWYSGQLHAMERKSLSCGALDLEAAYRFTWLRSFDHPISIQITHSSERTSIDAVELDGAGGYQPGKILRRSARVLRTKEWDGARSRFESLRMARQDPNELGLDGAEWLFERRHSNDYAAVNLWSPATGSAHDLGLFMLRLVGWEPAATELY